MTACTVRRGAATCWHAHAGWGQGYLSIGGGRAGSAAALCTPDVLAVNGELVLPGTNGAPQPHLLLVNLQNVWQPGEGRGGGRSTRREGGSVKDRSCTCMPASCARHMACGHSTHAGCADCQHGALTGNLPSLLSNTTSTYPDITAAPVPSCGQRNQQGWSGQVEPTACSPARSHIHATASRHARCCC